MPNPRISVNKLGEYVQSTLASRRKRIVEDCKAPKKFVVTRYRDAKEILKSYFVNDSDFIILEDGLDKLDEIDPDDLSDFQQNDLALSKRALELAMESDLPDLEGFEVEEYAGENPKLKIKGVNISINPDLLISGDYHGKKIVGAIKFHFPKTNPLESAGREIVALLLKRFLDKEICQGEEIAHEKFCISIDITSKSFSCAPKSYKQRMNYVEAACEEIALWWHKE